MSLVVGQKLWFVPDGRLGRPRETTVTKVGRKWATLDTWGKMRINVETLEVDGRGYMSPGQCYLSRADWTAAMALAEAWQSLWREMHQLTAAAEGVTVADIKAARKLLRIDPPDGAKEPE